MLCSMRTLSEGWVIFRVAASEGFPDGASQVSVLLMVRPK